MVAGKQRIARGENGHQQSLFDGADPELQGCVGKLGVVMDFDEHRVLVQFPSATRAHWIPLPHFMLFDEPEDF